MTTASAAISSYLRQNLESLFFDNKVNLVIQGHQHSYGVLRDGRSPLAHRTSERTCQVYQQECRSDGTGTVYLTVGTAGNPLETTGFDTQEQWSVSHTESYGFSRVQATPSKMSLQFVLNVDGAVFDELELQPWN